MTEFIKNPNLPEKRVRTVVCGTHDEKILEFFKSQNINVIPITANRTIDFSVSGHADMAAIHLGGNKILTDKSQTVLCETLSNQGMEVILTENPVSGDYPDDIGLNFALFGDFAVGNFRYADKKLLDCTENKTRINVKQGYAKCSVLVVNEKAVITDDESIYRKAVEKGIDCLLISKGDISLEGHEYGFIGGASGKISNSTVVFFGNVEKHCNFNEIRLFLEKNGCDFRCTDSGKLRDIGGIISIK